MCCAFGASCHHLASLSTASLEGLDLKYEYILRNTAFGIFVGLETGIVLAWLLSSSFGDEIAKFYTYMIAASLSLIAAALTLFGVFANIENQNNAETERRRRKLQSAKSFLPASLSRMCELCSTGVIYSHRFNELSEELGEDAFQERSLKDLSFPEELVTVFRDIIELNDDPIVTGRISELLKEHQVFFARWRSLFREEANIKRDREIETRQRTVSWAYLYAITASLFDYARDQTDSIEKQEGLALISSALNVTGLRDFYFDDLGEEISLYARRFERLFN
jgi:hypothetical protein